MEDDQIEKLIREHPYLIDSTFVRSTSEATKIAEEGGFPSCAEFIKMAKERSSLDESKWKAFEEACMGNSDLKD